MATSLSSINSTLLPPTITGPIFDQAIESSAVMSLARRVPLSMTAQTAIPVSMDVPAAGWVSEGGSEAGRVGRRDRQDHERQEGRATRPGLPGDRDDQRGRAVRAAPAGSADRDRPRLRLRRDPRSRPADRRCRSVRRLPEGRRDLGRARHQVAGQRRHVRRPGPGREGRRRRRLRLLGLRRRPAAQADPEADDRHPGPSAVGGQPDPGLRWRSAHRLPRRLQPRRLRPLPSPGPQGAGRHADRLPHRRHVHADRERDRDRHHRLQRDRGHLPDRGAHSSAGRSRLRPCPAPGRGP